MKTLRPYQKAAIDAAMRDLKTGFNRVCVEVAGGGGKSFIIAEICRRAKGSVLVLQPSQELTEQNFAEYEGDDASIYATSCGSKVISRVTYAMPQSIKEKSKLFDVCITDEAHEGLPRTKRLTEHCKYVIGFTATPMRLGMGYIYGAGKYFQKLSYSIQAKDLKDYLCQLDVVHPAINYDETDLVIGKNGEYDLAKFDRKDTTYHIIQYLIKTHRHITMIFAQTTDHAHEIMTYLPPNQSALVSNRTKKQERQNIIRRSREGEIGYLVNIQTLTRGFNVPAVDTVAILRPTTSPALHGQIIARAARKSNSLDDTLAQLHIL